MNRPLLFEALLHSPPHSEFLSVAQMSFGYAKALLLQSHSLPFPLPRTLHPTCSYSLCVTDVFDKRKLDPCKKGQFHEAIYPLVSVSCCVSLSVSVCFCLCASSSLCVCVSLHFCLNLCLRLSLCVSSQG